MLAATCLAAGPAQAVVYTGSHTADTATVDVSITTDGTLGVLSMANVLSWSFTLTDPGGTVTLDTGNSSFSYLSGNAFQATATDIVFDYTAIGHMQWDNGASTALCFDTPAAQFSCSGVPPSEVVVVAGSTTIVERAGRFVLGTSGAVPEPASWAMMIAGFGLVGAAARRRRPATALGA